LKSVEKIRATRISSNGLRAPRPSLTAAALLTAFRMQLCLPTSSQLGQDFTLRGINQEGSTETGYAGRGGWEANLFGYANHNADRLTQQITQFLCARHEYRRPGDEPRSAPAPAPAPAPGPLVAGLQPRAWMIPEDELCLARQLEAVINNQLGDEHNKNENRNPNYLRPSLRLAVSLAPCSISVCQVIC